MARSEAKFREMSNFTPQRVGVGHNDGRQMARGPEARQLSPLGPLDSISIKPRQVSILCHGGSGVMREGQGQCPGLRGSASVIIANKILITQECSVSPCKINPQPGPLSCLDQAEPRATAAHSTEPGPPLSHCVSTVIVKRLRLINHQKRHLLIIN